MRQPDWLGEAWKEFGVAEVKGARHNGRILAMFKDAGHPEIVNDEVAWCAAFLGACVERSGHRGTRSLLARSYLNWGVAIDTPHVGAIAVLSRGADPALGHVGFVVGEADGRLYILGGNQSNRVSVAAFDRSRLLGLRWPQGASASDADTAAEPSDADGPEATAVETEGPQAGDPQFQSALEHVLEMEGGYSDDPHDPGGPTNKGITIGVFARWIGEPINEQSRNRLVSRLKRIPDAMVREIYWT
ncbi:MAG: TIGR02594 family protein, partial [Hyphomicrobiaceae bacterium]